MRKFVYILLTLFLLCLIGGGIYAYQLFQSFTQTTEAIYEPLDRGDYSSKREQKPNIEDAEQADPISVLLLGVDERDGDRGRSDTIMVMTINPQKETSHLLSIPRDTMTEIVGRGTQDKINHAYAFGGIDMAIDTVEQFLDIPIDYFAKVNMEGLVAIVDLLGGITVEVEQSFTQDGIQFNPGEMEMDGQTALAYSRMRKQDPRGDFGRNDRQQQVVRSLLDEAISVQSLWKVDDIFEAMEQHVRTNQTRKDIDNMRKHYLKATRNIEKIAISGSGQTINNIYYYIVDEDERQRISSILREHLELN